MNSELCKDVPIDESQVWAVAIVGLVCGPLALLAVMLRTYSRYYITKQLGMDDWVMIASGVVLIVVVVLDIESEFHVLLAYVGKYFTDTMATDCYVNGFGRHYWNIEPTSVATLLKVC